MKVRYCVGVLLGFLLIGCEDGGRRQNNALLIEADTLEKNRDTVVQKDTLNSRETSQIQHSVRESGRLREKGERDLKQDSSVKNKRSASSVATKTDTGLALSFQRKGLTLDRLKYMAFLYVKINSDNIKIVQQMFDSSFIDTLHYERTKLSIEKNLRIIRLLNQVSVDKSNSDQQFAQIYLSQLIAIIKDGLVLSQEVLRYLQSIYDTEHINQQQYISSADNLKTNVGLMWDIIREVDYKEGN